LNGPSATRSTIRRHEHAIHGDLDEAIRIAARIPGARKGTVEVRPVLEIPGLPAGGGQR
jgi:hypothetical protein